jgi:hypothetical protein
MKRIPIGLFMLSLTLPGGAALAADETTRKPVHDQTHKRGAATQDAPCPEDPPSKKELKKKSTTKKKVEPAEKPSS